jgi:hypothetical protein
MLRDPTGNWHIAHEIVHLLWTYGQDNHPSRKSDLKNWDGNKFYMSFFRLDEDAKGFQVIRAFVICRIFNV